MIRPIICLLICSVMILSYPTDHEDSMINKLRYPFIDTRTYDIFSISGLSERNPLCGFENGSVIAVCQLKTWEQAMNHCVSLDGYLLPITDKLLKNKLRRKLDYFYDCHQFWLCPTVCDKASQHSVTILDIWWITSTASTESTANNGISESTYEASTASIGSHSSLFSAWVAPAVVGPILVCVAVAVIIYCIRKRGHKRGESSGGEPSGQMANGEVAGDQRSTIKQHTELCQPLITNQGSSGNNELPRQAENIELSSERQTDLTERPTLKDTDFKLNMVLAGFAYTGERDKVRCNICGLEVSGWNEDDLPFNEHQKRAPDCQFVKARLEEISKMLTLKDTDLDKVYDISDLHSTFDNRWPHQGSMFKQNVALAGFAYTGERDKVRCNICGLEISGWNENDVPFNEHQKRAPDCQFVKAKLEEISKLQSQVENGDPAEQADPDLHAILPMPDINQADPDQTLPTYGVNLLCFSCEKDRPNTLFLPCSHFDFCKKCSMDLRQCPKCKAFIKSKTVYS